MRVKFKAQRLENLRLAKKLIRTKAQKRKLTDKILEYSKRGDVIAIIENLNRAYEKGCLSPTSNTLTFIKDITANLSKSSKGKRYGTFSKGLYETLRIIGGPRSACLLAQHLVGPSE